MRCNDRQSQHFWSASKNEIIAYANIRKNAPGQGDGYPTVSLRDYVYFKENYKLVVINQQQALNALPKVIQQINSTGNLKCGGNTTTFSFSKK